MSDDIVTRLREEKCVISNGVRRAVPIDPIQLEAADEIERLRKNRAAWRELAEFIYPFVVDVDLRSVVAESVEGMMIAVREAVGDFDD